jgi:putative endonuclease
VWYVYVLRCSDGTLYTGVTNDLARRMARHNAGSGAKYTRGRHPLELVYTAPFAHKGDALRREAEVKRMKRAEKLRLAGMVTEENSVRATGSRGDHLASR